MPRSRWMSSKRRTPRNESRRINIVHRSPMTSTVRAIEQPPSMTGDPKAVGCNSQPTRPVGLEIEGGVGVVDTEHGEEPSEAEERANAQREVDDLLVAELATEGGEEVVVDVVVV